jgi:hypothetical protein
MSLAIAAALPEEDFALTHKLARKNISWSPKHTMWSGWMQMQMM